MRAPIAGLLLLLPACGFSVGAELPSDGGGDVALEPDAPPDIAIPFDATLSGVDFLPTSEETFVNTNWNPGADVAINTTTMTILPLPPIGVTFSLGQQDSGGSVAILRVGDFVVGAGRAIRVTGDKPLVILSDHDVTITGLIDAGAHKFERGPGGALGGTGAGVGGISVHDNGTGSTYDDSGAGGGSFGSMGASGGTAGPFAGGSGGATYPIAILAGGSGGGLAGACVNVPGSGGGAVLLYGMHKIRITGAINVGGGGGGGGVMACATGSGAGAGAGSGGLLWLQTPDLDGTGTLAANGGGGGGGSYVSIADGGDGEDGKASTTIAALGGAKANTTEASLGGNGAVLGTAPTTPAALTAGNGGGGGGGLGRIVYRAPSLGTLQASPTAAVP